MGALSKLEAVNRILRAAGEFPVSTLQSTTNDSLLAEQVLDEWTLYANMEGDLQNTVYTTLSPTTDGQYIVPDNVIEIETWDDDYGIIVATRGTNPTYLYDVAHNTTYFKDEAQNPLGKLSVKQILRLQFEELPTAMQFKVADHSARTYQMQTVGDVNQDAALAQQAMLSEARSKQANVRSMKANFLWGSSMNPERARQDDLYPGSQYINPRTGY